MKRNAIENGTRIALVGLAAAAGARALPNPSDQLNQPHALVSSTGDFVPNGLLSSALNTITVERAYAQGNDIKNASFGELPAGTWFHPKTNSGEVWTYDYTLQDPQLGGSTSLSGNDHIKTFFLNGGDQNGDTGVNVLTDPAFYKKEGARAAAWIDNAGAGDIVFLMDQNNQPIGTVTADGHGFAGMLLPDLTQQQYQFGIRVHRTNGQAQPIQVRLGNWDGNGQIAQSVMDAGNKLSPLTAPVQAAPAPSAPPPPQAVAPQPPQAPRSVDFLAAEQIRPWLGAEGQGFFRPVSSNGVGYTRFMQFSAPTPPFNPDGTPQFSFRDKGNVGEFFALVRGAKQVRLDMKTFAPFVEDLRQHQAIAGLWMAGMQPGTIINLHDMGGVVRTTAVADGSGFGGMELPTFNSQFTLTLEVPFPSSPADIQFQMGAGDQNAVNKASTLKLANVDPASIRV